MSATAKGNLLTEKCLWRSSVVSLTVLDEAFTAPVAVALLACTQLKVVRYGQMSGHFAPGVLLQ